MNGAGIVPLERWPCCCPHARKLTYPLRLCRRNNSKSYSNTSTRIGFFSRFSFFFSFAFFLCFPGVWILPTVLLSNQRERGMDVREKGKKKKSRAHMYGSSGVCPKRKKRKVGQGHPLRNELLPEIPTKLCSIAQIHPKKHRTMRGLFFSICSVCWENTDRQET